MAKTLPPKVITLNRDDARWFVDAALSSISTDDVTPVICSARITVTGKSIQIVSTDRYRVTRATASAVESTADQQFLMPREALAWLGKNLAVFGQHKRDDQRVVLTVSDDDELTVGIRDAAPIAARKQRSITWQGGVTLGNYPPMDRLFDTAHAAESHVTDLSINLDFLARARVLGGRHGAPVLKFTATENPNKPGPLLMTFLDPFTRGVRAEVIIQPNLLIR